MKGCYHFANMLMEIAAAYTIIKIFTNPSKVTEWKNWVDYCKNEKSNIKKLAMRLKQVPEVANTCYVCKTG